MALGADCEAAAERARSEGKEGVSSSVHCLWHVGLFKEGSVPLTLR